MSTPEREFAEAGVKLAEHLMHRSVRRVIDPLIEGLRTRLATYFRKQGRTALYFHAVGTHWEAVTIKGFDTMAFGAYTFGAHHAGLQLAWISEARKKTPAWLTLLPGITRRGSDVERDIDATSHERIDALVAEMEASGSGEAAILRAIKQQFRTWAAGEPSLAPHTVLSRSEAIAATEIASAYHHGMRDVALQVHRGGNGPVEKAWDAQPDACEICLANAAEGYIDAEAPFDSGRFEPPEHPNCRCSLSYRTIEA